MYELLIILLILIDQGTKVYAQRVLMTGGSLSVIEGIFNLTYVENRGAAFGMMQGRQELFIIIAVVVTILGIVYIHKKTTPKIVRLSIAMIIAGAIGNLIDRVNLGYVVDFFDFKFIWSYVFNFADIQVVIGTFLLCIYIFISDSKEKKLEKRKRELDEGRK